MSGLRKKLTDLGKTRIENEPSIKSITINEMKQMLSEFMTASIENQLDIEKLRNTLSSKEMPTTPTNDNDAFFDNRSDKRRSSIFFGSPLKFEEETDSNKIQELQSDIVYEKELKISSLEGLQYLSNQL
jgi:hypothetical protein